jgi:hypothetical protein
VSNTSEPSL